MKLAFQYMGQSIEMVAEPVDGAWKITLPSGAVRTIDIRPDGSAVGGVAFELTREPADARDKGVHALPVAHTQRGTEISYEGRTYVFDNATSAGSKRKSGPAASGKLLAPMVGVAADVLVSEGDAVAAYQPVAIVEAMKVMATIESPFAGRVARIYIKKGAQLEHGEPIMDIVPNDKTV